MKVSLTAATVERGRLFNYGGAAACLVIVSQVLQLSALSLSLQIAVVAAAVVVLGFIAFAAINEIHLSLGEGSYPHFLLIAHKRIGICVQVIGCSSFRRHDWRFVVPSFADCRIRLRCVCATSDPIHGGRVSGTRFVVVFGVWTGGQNAAD